MVTFSRFEVGKCKVAPVKSYPIAKIIPQASHVSSRLWVILMYTSAFGKVCSS